jgi:lysophospholipase L1-like esterase
MLGTDVTAITTIPDGTAKPAIFLSSADPQSYTLAACYDPTVSPYYGWGTQRVEQAKDQMADALLVALGTNDIRVLQRTPEQIVACLVDMSVAALPLRTFIATLPPDFEFADQTVIQDTNQLIRDTFDAENILDFDSGFTEDLFRDPVHLNDAGQLLRAQRARQKLAAADH